MKKTLGHIATLGLLAALPACESDLDTVTYNAGQAKPADLSPIEASYVLDAQKSDETAIVLRWTAPETGIAVSVTNNVEMDIAGNGFANKRTLGSTTADSLAITVADLNNHILTLLGDTVDAAAVKEEIRVSSVITGSAADTLYSAALVVSITPYTGEREYPKLWIIGDYCEWDHGKAQFVYSANGDDNYAGMVYFDGKAANGWKFTPAANWDNDWGAPEGLQAEAASATLAAKGANIEAYSHTSYYLEFNTSTAELKVSKPHDSWGIVGDFNGWAAPDVPMTLHQDEASGNYYLEATVDLTAAGGWKMRPDETWSDDVGPGAVEIEDNVEGRDGNFFVKEDGNYTIRWYFNKVTQKLVVTKN